jgi:hypothetical protein
MDAKTLRALRRMTVANGCTPAEAEVAARKIAEWEARSVVRRRVEPKPDATVGNAWIKPPRWNFADAAPVRRRLDD